MFGSGNPQRFGFNSYEVALKVLSWGLVGISPDKLLFDKFKKFRELIREMLEGIPPHN